MSEKTAPSESKANSENASLINLIVNVLIPVIALGFFSKDEGGICHFGPLNAMIIAISFPLVYGVWDLMATKKVNAFSLLGIVSVALTGGLTLYLWNEDGSVKASAPLIFSSKEALMPLILGAVMLLGGIGKDSLFRMFLYNDSLFDVNSIEKEVETKGIESAYEATLKFGSYLFIGSFLLSSVLNFGLSMYFLQQVDYASIDAKIEYNEAVSKITGWGYVLIGVPLIACTFGAVYLMSKKLVEITGLPKEKVSFTGL